jgi:hypothetical protein
MGGGCDITEILQTPALRAYRNDSKMKLDSGYTPVHLREIVRKYKESLRSSSGPQTRQVLGLLERIENLDSLMCLEARDCCYAGLPLTPNDNKRFIETEFEAAYKRMVDRRTKELREIHEGVKACIFSAGLTIYDPAEAPFNPNKGLVGTPQDIYDVDQLMVMSAKFFSMTNVMGSTGAGIEEKTAIEMNKFPVILTKKGVYVSRMSTGARKIILLEFSDISKDSADITAVFKELQKYEPGIGVCSKHGVDLLGFKGDNPVCLRGEIAYAFPNLVYDFSQFTKK